jgi:riboflavin kinase/FMN adenylyltransferase
VRPTFSEGVLSIELHLLDFSGDLYGKSLQVEIIEKLRDERRFESVEDLVGQIKLDIDQARAVLV